MYKAAPLLIVSWFIVTNVTSSPYPAISEECPDPSWRNPYDPALAFNRYLGTNSYPLHPRNDAIVARVLKNMNENKVSWSRKVPIFVVEPDSQWETFDVEYNHDSNWTKFKIPPAELVAGEMGTFLYDSAQDFPFLIFDPNSTLHGLYTELRGFHTFIDYATKTFYCEGCGLFKYNNNGDIIPPATTAAMGDDYIGQGTGCGLSWPGVVRRDDVLSGVIAHAIRASWSSCDFFDSGKTEWVSPATKTDQPNGVSQAMIDTVTDNERVGMGYRFRLDPTTTCDDRLAPMYENNGLWYPPTPMMTAFTRMFCTALRDYGFILSDGSGDCQSSIFQGESQVTANWTAIFDAEPDESTLSWSFLIRDRTTPNDNRYRDERYGIPWHMLQILNDSDVGDMNDCCKNDACAPPPPHVYEFVDTTPGPKCLNENCCFKHRNMTYRVRIADDNCVIYNCTFSEASGSDIVIVKPKRDGTYANNTWIGSNTFYVGSNQDAVQIDGGMNTKIYDNWFSDTISDGYAPISLTLASNVDIENNIFTGNVLNIAIDLNGINTDDIQNVNIIGNAFDSMQYGVHMYRATNTNIKNNVFTNFASTGTAIRWKYAASYEEISDGVNIEGNMIQNVGRGIYVGYDIGMVTIIDNRIDNTTSSNGIEFSGTSTGAVVDGNIISNTTQLGINVATGNDNIQITNNEVANTGDDGVQIQSDNFFISANTIHAIDTATASSGKALYLHSYGTVARNKIYSATRRGISIAGTAATAGGALIIENNMIYGIDAEPIHFYVAETAQSPTKTIIRFNTIVTDTGSKAILLSPNVNEYDIYCNLVVADTNRAFWSTSASYVTNEFGNAKYTAANISRIAFVNDDLTALDSVDLHLQVTSPVMQQCDGLETALYPLPSVDFDGVTRSVSYIDVGADQKSPVLLTTAPTGNPVTTAPTGNPVTTAPTGNPVTTVLVTTAPTGNPVTTAPTGNPVTKAPTESPSAGHTATPTESPVATETVAPTDSPATGQTVDPTVSGAPSESRTTTESTVFIESFASEDVAGVGYVIQVSSFSTLLVVSMNMIMS